MKVTLMDMTLKEIQDSGPFEVAVLPWGACEPHNLHLPYGCDTFTVDSVARISAEKARKRKASVVVLPTMPVGVNSNQIGFPLVLHCSPSTQLSMIRDIVWSLEQHGVRKLVLMNGHGGNQFKSAARELYGATKVHIFVMDWWLSDVAFMKSVSDDPGGEHGNEIETSWMLYLRPELVHLRWADDGTVKRPRLKALEEGWVSITRPWHILTTNAGHGNPRKATPEKGQKMIEHATDRIADFLTDLSRSKIDATFPY